MTTADLAAACARHGWTLIPDGDGWMLRGNGPLATFGTTESLAVWLAKQGEGKRKVKPYYEANGITIYHGDARDILSQLPPVDCIITDPVWPNAPAGLYQGADDPIGLFTQIAAHFPRLAQRAVVQLGCNSDPRFLGCVPPAMPFLRACWLEYALPSHIGRVLYSGDLAYVYGAWPESRVGARVFPGVAPKAQPKRYRDHPTPRAIEHVRWLVGWYARGRVLDPCCGLGTTLRAAKDLGFEAIGVEVDERYCDAAARRMSQEVMELV